MDQSLAEFYRKYSQQIDPPGIPSGSVLRHPDVQLTLERRFFNQPASEYSAYQAKILRAVVERIQQAIEGNDEEEVSDHLMTLLATLPHSRPTVDLSKTLVSYVPPVGFDADIDPIEILEAKKIIGSGPNTGLRTWEAALRLASYLHSQPELIRGKRVLELGAGTGFLSIFCAAYLQPETVTATDGHEDVLVSLEENVERNSHHYQGTSHPTVQRLYWGDEDDLSRIIRRRGDATQPGPSASDGIDELSTTQGQMNYKNQLSPSSTERPYDIIIGADITYEPEACKALAETLSRLAKANPYTDILISATQRNLQTLSGFLDECHGPDCGLRVEVVKYDVPPLNKQTGLFHNIVSPIQIFAMRYSPPEIS
ncbi:uncharacterized protein HMPREF1541_01712 [Cyphellophora europaea CBS 101466]|uniref:FAM86 N-terminal domain-containing protein n=1 Tax=Cyphellophora europaea (strain CBS 101466) TaxID=1220924 RepID=W2S1U7_CYPE1|nr:uncharacterized protein HMPREF1541_01712 [Cyphellophora europaea CBS 101466]ETN42555.1 hypothetical protein HMPREF1541_01712 [Cyphellophora europaea CBS 101466]